MRFKLAPWRLTIYLAAVLVAAAGVFIQTPYSLLAPGRAVDLRIVVAVAGHRPPATHYYMTDVGFIAHASPFGLLAGLEPGWQIVQTEDLVPSGVDDATYEKVMGQAMNQSQTVATYVAERAAGLPVGRATSQAVVHEVLPQSHARGILRPGDIVVSVNGEASDGVAGLQAQLANVTPGAAVKVVVRRQGIRVAATIQTVKMFGSAHLGVTLSEVSILPAPAVPVRFSVHHISGSSGGVMFALEVYRSFRPAPRSPAERIAGTGTLDSDGNVGEIAGTMQKLVAAQRAGASLFLVPVENYADIHSVTGIKIVPIRTFEDAIRATGGV